MRTLLAALLFFGLTVDSINAQELSNEELSKRVEILADEINQLKAYQLSVSKNESKYGLSPSASKVYHIPQGLSVGGYGEVTYLHDRAEDQDGDAIDNDPTSEVLRNILYLGYKFNDKWLINMELEIEHVSQVYTEFMYLDYLHSQELNFRSGLMLHPIGFVNELHEPTVFNGVLRPRVETVIIPTTWRSLGVGAFGTSGRSTYKFYVMNGMNAQGFSASSNRGARKRGGHYSDSEEKTDNQRTSTAIAVWRYDFQATDSLMLGTSGLVGQASGDNEDLDHRMLSLHAEYNSGAHRFRFLGVRNTFANVDDWNDGFESDGTTQNAQLNESQTGGYIEYQYTITGSGGSKYVPFIRLEQINLQAQKADGIADDASLERRHATVGLNYFPLDRVVFKADYTKNTNEADSGVDQFALGLGYNF
ncbi:MAG: hypothetical protein CME65_12925 [Halobacteriovoraceae bacterium]|nr:hypothetical protein [Halobacteriovoraceae bacterium]|tara:strand:+ start:5961 stop:7220 length:1260 start_codon:yes stop_codon:yes gene_type:complete